MDKLKETKKCSKCRRILPKERFSGNRAWCKSCATAHYSEVNGFLTKESLVKIERLYKQPIPQRMLDVKEAGIKLVGVDECFAQLINYKKAWISNYGRVLEYYNGKYIFKRTKKNSSGELECTLQKNVYNGEKWIWQRHTIEIWRLVVGAFIVNFDMVGNTHCWHKDNNKNDNYYKNIYPVGEKQYHAVLDKYLNGENITDEVITDIVNDILYKADDWYVTKWVRRNYGVGYLGCNDANTNLSEDRYIYDKWANMIQRCYDGITHKLKPYYAQCTVCIEWQNFSNFRVWFKENAMGDRKVDLDKDIMIKGNTVYSQETCALVTHFTNTIFEERGLDTNIVLNNSTQKYDVTMIVLGKNENVGSFDTKEDGKKAYIDYKQDYIRKHAKNCKGKVPNKTYEAMMNWKVG